MRILDIVGRDELVALSRPSDAIASMHLALRVTVEVILFAAAVLLLECSFALSLMAFCSCAVWHSFWGYAGLGHELYHARVFSVRWLNEAMFQVASYLTWNNPEFFRRSHTRHHRFTFAKNDTEGFSRQDWRWLAVAFYLTVDLPLVARRLFYVAINAAGYSCSASEFIPIGPAFRKEALRMLAFNVALQLALWLFLRQWQANLMWLLLPFSGQFLNRLLAQSQHIGLASFKDGGPLQHSRTVRLPALIEFLYAGMNFHVEHHLAPGIPYYNLPLLHFRLVHKRLLFCPSARTFFLRDIWTELKK